jgi:colanic acid biosynthesis glycosyl transferase WcaI
MKILFLSDNFPPETNAPAARTYEHAVRWVRAGHQVTVITCAPNFPEGVVHPGYKNYFHHVELMAGIRVIRVKTYITANEGFLWRTLDYMSFMFSSVLAGLFEKRPDVLVATSPQFFCACAGWLLSVLRGLPFVFELRDLWPATILAVGAMKRGFVIRLLEWIELFLYRHADGIVSLTEAFKKDLVGRGVSETKIAVITNGADLEHFIPVMKDIDLASQIDVDGKFVVGYVGTHGLTHGLETVLEAAKLLKDEPSIVLMFVGAGADKAHLQQKAREEGISNALFLQHQPKDRMPRLWSVCDLALIPLKNQEIFRTVIPSKLFEAMAMGVPIVMSIPEGEATEVLKRCGAGVDVPPENPGAMAEAIRCLMRDNVQRASLRANGIRMAGHYSRENQANNMLSVLDAVARNKCNLLIEKIVG